MDHGDNKIPKYPSRLLLSDLLHVHVENNVLGLLTKQWSGCTLQVLRQRQGHLLKRWESKGSFCMWFEGWLLLTSQRRLCLLQSALAFDEEFAVAMFDAVCRFEFPELETLD